MDRLYENFNKLLKATSTDFIRYKYAEINWDSHMLGLVGPRGVGKTTMFLQHIKQSLNPKETLYVSADNMYHLLSPFYDSYHPIPAKIPA